jgi:hypothetical protein
MIRVVKRQITEKVNVKDLFEKMNVPNVAETEYDVNFDLKVKTPYGYHTVPSLHRTDLQKSIRIYFSNNKTLECSWEHKIKANGEWKLITDIEDGEIIETESGVTTIKKIHEGKDKILYDLSVDKVHCFYSNSILSHNTWILCALGAGSMKRGSNVVHYTLELNEAYVGLRYDSCFTGIANQNLKYHQEDVQSKIENIKGELVVKYFPTKTASVNTISAHLQKMRMMGKSVDMVVVDYADILKDTGSAREVRHALGNIYEDLRGMAGEFQIPVWTASQANRSSLDEDIIEANKIAESYQKIMTADFVVSLSRKVEDKIGNTGRFHVIKNRFGPDGLTFPAKVNTNTGAVEIYESASIGGKETQGKIDNRDNLMKKMLSNRYDDLMGE